MHELRLLFAPAENGSFIVTLEPAGVPVPLTPFLTDSDYENLRWYLEDYMDLPDGGAVIRAQGVEQQIQSWGRRLHEAVFSAPENAALLKQLLASPEPRELTIATDHIALLRLPWELMADAAGNLAQRVSVRRQLEEPKSLVPREVSLPLRVLGIVSRPADTGFIDPRLTTRALFDALDPLQGNVRLDFCRPPTLPQMEEMLRAAQDAGDPYDLVHFDGHGTFLPESQIGALCFEKPDDGSGDSRTDLVPADRLGDLLAQYRIPLVVLEACRSATVGKTAVFRSVAPRLIHAGVASVLSMGHAVHVEAARILLDRFYRELARGTTIGHAVAHARSALRGSPARWVEYGPGGKTIELRDWFLPHLYQRGLDEPLLPRGLANQQPVRRYDVFLSHNHADSVRVESLARILTEKHGLRIWLDKWECGPGALEPQCEAGIRDSRFTVVVGSQAALNSRWVRWEIDKHNALNPDGASLSDPRLTRDQLDPLLRDLADHPLSLELVGPHLRTLTPEAIRADFARLVETLSQDSDQTRNTSLHASLEFSRRHLSAAARAALPWLGLFSGGVFEDNLLDVCQLTPEAWSPIRHELESIALLRPEEEFTVADRPFLRFHPTLAIASAEASLAENPQTRERFVLVYLALMQALGKALLGSQSRAALAILDREEMNYRTAVRWAIADGQLRYAARLGEIFLRFLQMSGRLRERDTWVQLLHAAVQQGGFTAEAAGLEMAQAWTRFTQGDPQGAVDQLTVLVARLRQTTEFDPAFELALALRGLGQVFVNAGASTQAIPVTTEAIGLWKKLVEQAGGAPWQSLLSTPDHAKATAELGNLSAAMGDHANALLAVGQHEEALEVAEAALTIQERRGNQREVAASIGRCASILMAAGRYEEADARYEQALAAAVQAGDKELEGITLQHQGMLADDRSQLDRATRLYQQALLRFQVAGNQPSVMRTYNLLGVTEQNAGRLAEARAWYEKSRTLAMELQDQASLGQAAQNIGIVCQEEGEAARVLGDEAAASRHFAAARRAVEEGLDVWKTQQNQPEEAGSLSQFGSIHLLLGDLDAAERHAHAAREIRESLGLKEAWKDYDTLSEIAAARGDTSAAAEWAEKRDALLAELKERAGGGSGPPAQMIQGLAQLALACARAGFGDGTLGPAETEALATLDGYPAPFPDFAAHLRQLAAGELRSIPPGLPKELHDVLSKIHGAVRGQTG